MLDGGLVNTSALSRLTMLLSLSGCASFSSEVGVKPQSPDVPNSDGAVYYMPRQPIQIILTVDAKDNSIITPSIGNPPVIPDLSQAFVLEYNRNWVGTNHLTMGISSAGLLNSANGTTTSSFPSLASAIGSLAGDISAGLTVGAAARPESPPPTESTCATGAVYSILVFPEAITTPDHSIAEPPCGLKISVERLGPPPGISGPVSAAPNRADVQGKKNTGIFYKHNIPYLISVSKQAIGNAIPQTNQFLAFSPDEAEIDFAPASKSLFANASTNITLSNGILTGIDNSSDSELVALLSLPSQVISSYFSAVSSIFGSLGSLSSSQATLAANSNALALAEVKQHICAAAIAANPLSGKSPAELQAAVTNIQAACSP